MIITSNCTNLVVNSEIFDGAKIYSFIQLKYKKDCAVNVTTVNLNSLIPSITTKIEIPATTFYNDLTKTTYCDGIYNFELIVRYYTEDPEVISESKETSCHAILCNIKCKALEKYSETKNNKLLYYVYALEASNDCDNCTCSNMCAMYTELKSLINDYSNLNNGCGCN